MGRDQSIEACLASTVRPRVSRFTGLGDAPYASDHPGESDLTLRLVDVLVMLLGALIVVLELRRSMKANNMMLVMFVGINFYALSGR